MSRQDDALKLGEELLADIELQRLKASEIVLKANRLARLVGHDELSTLVGHELNGYSNDGNDHDWLKRTGRVNSEAKVYVASIAKIEAAGDGARAALVALQSGGKYSGEFVARAAREHDQTINMKADTLSIVEGIARQVVAAIYGLIVEIYHELLFSDLQATLFAATQADVDGALAQASGSALDKIEKVSDRLRDGDPESVSQGLTSCRRLIDAVANHVFPGREESYDIDGQPRPVGESNVLNRLQAYCYSVGLSKGRRDRLRRSLEGLYDRCSKGAHSEVTIQEARYVFLQTYVVLGELLTAEPVAETA